MVIIVIREDKKKSSLLWGLASERDEELMSLLRLLNMSGS